MAACCNNALPIEYIHITTEALLEEILSGDNSTSRVSFLSHHISRKDLRPGDHIYVYRALGLYSHHGIYSGEEGMEVIHFSDPNGIKKTRAVIHASTLDEFCSGGWIRLVAYGASHAANTLKRKGTCHHRYSQLAVNVIRTAQYFCKHPDEFKTYDLKKNNCEHFATLCKTGDPSSKQANVSVDNMVGNTLPAQYVFYH